MLKKIWYILSKKQKQRLFFVAMITFVGNLFETMGVSIILPFINAILTPDKLMQNAYMQPVLQILHITTAKGMVIMLTMAIIVLYWIKNIYMLFMNSIQYRYIYNNRRRLSDRLLKTYVQQPYLYHVEHNSAELIRNVSTDVDMFFTSVLQLIHLQTNGGMCFLLLCILFYKDKTITLAAMLSMVAFMLFYSKALKHRTQKAGENNRVVSKELQQHMMQTFQGIKEIKIRGKENYFFEKYDKLYRRMVKANHSLQMYTIIPKPIMETVCITGILGIITLKVYRGVDLAYFVPTLAMFAVAAFRMFPAAATITSSISSYNANKKSIDAIYDILLKTEFAHVEDDRNIEFHEKISLEKVTFRYPNTEKNILKDIDLTIEKNKSTAFIGTSGGGKSTLVDIILGLLPPSQGKVVVDGVDIQGHTRKWQDQIGYIPQVIYLSDESIKKNIAFGLEESEIDEDRIWEAIKSAQLEEFVRNLKDGIETEIGEAGIRLSGGQRQRIGIARALYNMPEVLVLDEATSALDTETEKGIMETINKLKDEKTLIVIAHRLSTIKECDDIYRVGNGKIERTEIE